MKTTQIQLADVPSLGGDSHIEKALRAVPGVHELKVEGAAKRVTIEHEDADPAKLVQAIQATGVEARAIPDDAPVLSPSVPQMEAEEE